MSQNSTYTANTSGGGKKHHRQLNEKSIEKMKAKLIPGKKLWWLHHRCHENWSIVKWIKNYYWLKLLVRYKAIKFWILKLLDINGSITSVKERNKKLNLPFEDEIYTLFQMVNQMITFQIPCILWILFNHYLWNTYIFDHMN